MRFTHILYDFKLIKKDPMLLLVLTTPLIFSALLLLAFPPIAQAVLLKWDFDINIYFSQTGSFFLLLIPMLFGMVYGFILLDERDAGIITAISITPFGKKKYLLTRMGIPMLFTFIISFLMILFLNISPALRIWQIVISAIILAIQTPMMLLFLGAFAGNKIEGMALTKSFSLMLIGIFIDFAAPAPWNWFGAISPLFWMERMLLSEATNLFILYAAASSTILVLINLLLYRKFLQRVG